MAMKQFKVKVLCNWCDSHQLLDSKWFEKMKPPGTCVEFVTYDNADFFLILNKPLHDKEYYRPDKTIVITLEPWCDKPSQNWGVKTWGQWAKPDPRKFLSVRSHDTYVNGLHWEITKTYKQLIEEPILKSALISTVTTSKYFDPGHIFRVDFIKYLEKVGIPVDIYGYDNHHGFKGYKGPHPINNKDMGILPYKYYFHAENNDEYNFITEKIWDSVLAECVCFYWGCPNIRDYVDSSCYIELSPKPEDFEKNANLVRDAINNDEWGKRIQKIRAEKRRIMDTFNLYHVVENVIRGAIEPPIYIVFHCCTLGKGVEILENQIKRIKNTQLYNRCKKIFVFTIGPKQISPENKLRLSQKIHITHISDDPTTAEQLTNHIILI